jgi:DNA-binding Lrp family transcriptional regulator
MAYGVPPPPAPDRRAELDDADRKIIEALGADGRLSMRALAEQVHLSRAGVYSRVARLEKLGIITGYTAVIDPVKLGYGVSAYIYLRIAQQSWKAVRQRISEIPEVEHAALISGDDDLALLVRTTDAASLRDLVLTRLQTMPDVVSTKTVLILDELPWPRQTGPGSPRSG